MIYYSELYDLYKNLLTDKQKSYFEEYYFKNLSFSEIAENYNISRNGVYNQVKFTKELLEDYEKKLHLKEKQKKIEKIIQDEEKIEKIREIIFE
ncbi:MAG: hypothetical protein HFJ38_00885 [Bacilli bacterium]|nr:hypothetical protein [Bacilli bacterium]